MRNWLLRTERLLRIKNKASLADKGELKIILFKETINYAVAKLVGFAEFLDNNGKITNKIDIHLKNNRAYNTIQTNFLSKT